MDCGGVESESADSSDGTAVHAQAPEGPAGEHASITLPAAWPIVATWGSADRANLTRCESWHECQYMRSLCAGEITHVLLVS